MNTLIWKLLPYALAVLGGIMFFGGLSAVLSPPPTEPVEMSISDLETTDARKLPAWVKVDDGLAFWVELTTIFKEGDDGEVVSYDEQFVPLLSQKSVMGWEADTTGDRQTVFVVRYSWSKLEKEFPGIAALASGEDPPADFSEDDLIAALPTSFSISGPAVGIGDPEKKVVAELKAKGFQDVVWVRPGSAPMGKGGEIKMLVGSLVLVALAVLWILSRWSKKSA